jgi:hypothetical protein
MSTLNPKRPGMATDLTRWNRAGLSRFDYVDGDASVWLEELRIAMLGLYLRGGDAQQRTPEFWRDLYLRPKEDWPDVSQAAARVPWEKLAPVLPPQQESRGRRSERLLKQYGEHSDDYAWEINRAFARATHVLLGHLNAYANEGYLRTATQWDNLRRLAAMVNYQPTPPASATTTVALLLKDDTGAVAIPRGLAMKYTPTEGGAPLIFETLQTEQAHPVLNAARVENWNKNRNTSNSPVDFGETRWHLPEKDTLAPGELVVVVVTDDGKAVQPILTQEAHSIAKIDHDTDAQTADITLSGNPQSNPGAWSTYLYTNADDVRVGRQHAGTGTTIVRVDGGAGFASGDLVQVTVGSVPYPVPVELLGVEGDRLILDMDLAGVDELVVKPMASYALDDADKTKADKGTQKMYFPGRARVHEATGVAIPADGTTVGYTFTMHQATGRRGFAESLDAPNLLGKVEKGAPLIIHGSTALQNQSVSFEGKPPKGLAEGDWFVARHIKTDNIQALQVQGVRTASGQYHVQFDAAPEGDPQDTEFHGPMTRSLRPVGYNRNPMPAITGSSATLIDVPLAAQALLKPGRKMILSREQPDGTSQDSLTNLTAITSLDSNRVTIAFEPAGAGSGWAAGDTRFQLNCAQVSHGETKGSKTLGSGDGERAAQVFEFAVGNISHIPSSSAEAGVVPDIDVFIDGVRWDYRDYIDPSAEGARAWSTTLSEDGTLKIHFRRRLATGKNNVSVGRHRVGVGAAGSGIPPLSFNKPMKKDRQVEAIYQPFATSGGADREPVAKLRETAPARLAANGRAVSLHDFERLAQRHASVLRAQAEEIPTPTAARQVLLTLVPSGGAPLTATLENDLRAAILGKAIPGVRLGFGAFEALPLHLGATVRADLSSYDKTDVKAAAEAALRSVFALEIRDFAQPVYVAEVLAALETVASVENAIVTRFDLGDGYDLSRPEPAGGTLPWPKNVATRDEHIAAIFPTHHQIAYVRTPDSTTPADTIAIIVEDIQ